MKRGNDLLTFQNLVNLKHTNGDLLNLLDLANRMLQN